MGNHSLPTTYNLLFIVLFICQMLLLFGCFAEAYSNISCIRSERRALLDFKKGLIDESNRLSSWRGENCCTWPGIGCDIHTSRVLKLDLHNPIVFDEHRYYSSDPIYPSYYDTSRLKGGISPSLLNLKYLQHLDLSCNNFSKHQIPTFFGSFKYMGYLNLSFSFFEGRIPNHLGNLSRLHHLDLGDNYILNSKSLWWITRLSSLKSLNLFNVDLSGLNDWFQAVNMLPSLFSLNLAYCNLPKPSILFDTNFTSLVSLDLSGNVFNTSFPLWLFNVTSIEILNLNVNSFQGKLPNLFEKLTSLTKLNLSGNRLNSSFPNSLCSLTNLTHIDLSYNSFQGKLLFSLENLTSLTIIRLESNRFQGAIPFQIGHLQKLTQLDLSSNELNGTIPPSLWQLEKLQHLDISGNLFIGELKENHFTKLAELKYLDVSSDFLRLNFKSQWVPSFQLKEIIMDGIQVGPQFPQWLETQKSVKTLVMLNVSISDQIPNWFEVVYSQIEWLVLSHNQITGKPPQIKGAPNSSLIDMSFNKFNGSLNSIPRYIGELVMSNNNLAGQIPPLDGNQTRYLFLNDNGFTGNIPSTMCNQEILKSLDLSSNHLSGEIPFCLGNLRGLSYLNLANNSFFGQIPGSLGNLGKSLELLQLNGNKFHGKLPSSFQNLTSLRFLDLGNNQLSGTLSRWPGAEFWDLNHLVWLGLQSNNFNGSIPSGLCKLWNLRVLNLAQNNFTGLIPRCFGNFNAMKKNLDYQTLLSLSFWFEKEYMSLSIPIKGRDLKYSGHRMFATSIALSENKIVGEIPKELMNLVGLQSLNLSKNHLEGRIPENIGNMKSLESLDLSMNEISGSIPPSLATIDTLGYLNLSFNKLSGPIPEGNHFQTFDNKSIYEGNRGLCGKPLLNNCSGNKPSKKDRSINHHQGDSFDIPWFYAGIGPGFAVGFVGAVSILWFKKSWRCAYFRFLENLSSRMQKEVFKEVKVTILM